MKQLLKRVERLAVEVAGLSSVAETPPTTRQALLQIAWSTALNIDFLRRRGEMRWSPEVESAYRQLVGLVAEADGAPALSSDPVQ